ncbi:MAG: tRNA pseudouridine(55) synthase TruB [Mogibacterium sp.]|nr:tRNA pseudouridine(55) synthase TruB [Mogibacterium sp.]
MEFRDGIINIDKPEGWTSQDVCAKLRRRLHIKKIGHTGTLDPMATGVLPVCIGKATRIIEYYDNDMKTYRAMMRLGLVTDTLDITGEILETRSTEGVSETAIRQAFAAYTGKVEQIPPKYSALRINGKRAYDLARAGVDFELKTRTVMIPSNEVLAVDLEQGIVEFEVTCSKGTYIRTICDDIGRELGCGAAMSALRRTASGYFKAYKAVDIKNLVEMSDEEIAELIIPMDITLENLGIVELDDNRVIAFGSGNTSAVGFSIVKPSRMNQIFRVYNKGTFLGIATLEKRTLIPAKVIRTTN